MSDNYRAIALATIVQSPNVATLLESKQLEQIGLEAVEGYTIDLNSRSEWEQRNEKGLKLALQVQEAKNFPWENCSNVKFPLLTIAALQFLARVSVMTKGRKLVKLEHMGVDPDGTKAMRTSRVSRHMSIQLTDESPNWIDYDEQAKLTASIVGSAFKKTFHDHVTGVNVSEHVPAMNFVVDYNCKDVDKAHRATHWIMMSANAVQERIAQGVFLEMLEGTESRATPESTPLRTASDVTQGLQRPSDSQDVVYEILEQHTWLDLDGDGYAEPYILWVRRDTSQVLRILPRFYDNGDVYRALDSATRELEGRLEEANNPQEGEDVDLAQVSAIERALAKLEQQENSIVRIVPTSYFTRYLFIPSPDGGVYGLGLGALLGPMNEAVDSLTNQLIDSGTMSNTAGGFLGRGVSIKSGRTTFNPFEWKPVDSTGDDLRKNMFPLPVREPSAVLFQLLGMLVTYSEKISGATDIMTGVSPGQNTPAETSRNTVEQGMMLFSGIYNRMYRSFREELKKHYALNRLYLPSSPQWRDLTTGANAILAKDDYDTANALVFPAASSEAVSTTQKREKAALLLNMASTQPGFDRYQVMLNFLEAHDFDSIDTFYPDPKGPRAIAPPPNPKIELEKAKLAAEDKQHQEAMQVAVVELRMESALNDAKITELQAKATKHLADADGVQSAHEIGLIEAELGMRKLQQEGLHKALDTLQRAVEGKQKQAQMESKQPPAQAPTVSE